MLYTIFGIIISLDYDEIYKHVYTVYKMKYTNDGFLHLVFIDKYIIMVYYIHSTFWTQRSKQGYLHIS